MEKQMIAHTNKQTELDWEQPESSMFGFAISSTT